jgi:hypothetical protein
MRGEVRLDRDAAVFDVSLHDGQHSVHVVRARFLQVLEGHVKEVFGKHVLRSDLVLAYSNKKSLTMSAKSRRSAWDSGMLKCMNMAKTRKRQSPAPPHPRPAFQLNLRRAPERGSTCCRLGCCWVGLDDVEGVVDGCNLTETDCDPGVFDEVLKLVAEGSCSDGDLDRMKLCGATPQNGFSLPLLAQD